MKAHIRVLFGKNLNYAASKTSTTANTALNPADLRDGAIGFYAIDPTDNKFKLITDGTVTSCVADTVVRGAASTFVIAQGRSNNKPPLISQELKADFTTTYKSAAYEAAVKQISVVGYNGDATSGLNLPTLVGERNQGQITTETPVKETGDNQPGIKETFETTVGSAATAYTVLVGILNNHNFRNETEGAFGNETMTVVKRILHNGTGSEIANTATVAAVNGETSLTTSAAHGIGVGDWVSLGGDLYQAVTGTTGTTLVLDRPYNGATATIANAAAFDLGASVPTKLGIELESRNPRQVFYISSDGILQDATLKVTTDAVFGTGTPDQVKEHWLANVAMLGSHDRRTSYMPIAEYEGDPTVNYDIYQLKVEKYPQGTQGDIFNVRSGVDVYFPTGSGIGAKTEFEDIGGTLITGSDGLGGLDA